MNKLSDETLVRIFRILAALEGESWANLHAKHGPLSISAVCATWRRASIASPDLWCRFSVLFHPYNARQPRLVISKQIQTAKTWLRRAGKLPLHISFSDLIPRALIHPNLHIIHELVEPFQKQLVFLHIAWPHPEDLRHLVDTPSTLYPALHELKITSPPEDFSWCSSHTSLFPSLTKLTVSETMFLNNKPPAVNTLPIRWDQLTFLRLQRTGTLTDICAILPLCPSLTACHITALFSVTVPRKHKRVPLSRVRALTLELSSGPSFANFFRLFEMPALVSLSLGESRSIAPASLVGPLQGLPAFISPAGLLKRLSLGIACPPSVLVSILQRTQRSLQHLCLRCVAPEATQATMQTLVLASSLECLRIHIPERKDGDRIALAVISALTSKSPRIANIEVEHMGRFRCEAEEGECFTLASRAGFTFLVLEPGKSRPLAYDIEF
uniref:F-box domain-containing protein n=1 Tax=Mycena chlorophos TaxID=658473 RepID=A0ABQ0LDK1_MYCCL|nr:predicted protein [Mycena chlorophos]